MGRNPNFRYPLPELADDMLQVVRQRLIAAIESTPGYAPDSLADLSDPELDPRDGVAICLGFVVNGVPFSLGANVTP